MTTSQKVKLTLAAFGVVLVVIVALQNRQPVEIHVLFWRATVDRLLFIPGLFAMGIVVGLLVSWGWRRRRKTREP